MAETISDDDPLEDAPISESHGAIARGAVLGRYLVLEPLGAGGMGVVYAAYDPELDRKIAIKVLRDDTTGSGASSRRARFLREAQALARLDHPNIVRVHDVGTFEGQVFIAMELVAGVTMTAWIAAAPRPWRSVVQAYREAARGLAAAHALGIVHRDFKPDNVLIDGENRVRVVDFGLAAAAETAAPAAPGASELAGASLTRTGAVIGTPGYIAPEGGTAPAVDQFSLCTALWRDLFGELPFAGVTAEELVTAAAAERLREPGARPIPARLVRVMRRGLAADPARRFGSMTELAEALGPGRVRGRLVAAGIAVPLLVLAGFAIAPHHDASRVCAGAARRIAGAWDASAIGRAFATTGLAYAPGAATHATTTLARYSDAWTAMRTEACEATRVRGDQSEELLDLRVACLDQAARQLRALGGVLAIADRTTIEKSVAALADLPALADCADATALRDGVHPARDPVLRAAIAATRGALAEARVLDDTGKYPEALARLRPLVAEARALHDRDLEAGALRALGMNASHTERLDDAQTSLEDAVNAATATRDHALVIEASTELVKLIGFDRGQPERAEPWIARTRALLEAHPDERLDAALDDAVGNVRLAAGKYHDAIALFSSALARTEQRFGKDAERTAAVLEDLANGLHRIGQQAKSGAHRRRALAIEVAQLGPAHPRVAVTLSNLGASLFEEGKIDESIEAEQRALAIKEGAFGKDSPKLGSTLNELASPCSTRTAAIRSSAPRFTPGSARRGAGAAIGATASRSWPPPPRSPAARASAAGSSRGRSPPPRRPRRPRGDLPDRRLTGRGSVARMTPARCGPRRGRSRRRARACADRAPSTPRSRPRPRPRPRSSSRTPCNGA